MLDIGKERFGADQKNKRPSDNGRALAASLKHDAQR
jgi:hypothetical protein